MLPFIQCHHTRGRAELRRIPELVFQRGGLLRRGGGLFSWLGFLRAGRNRGQRRCQNQSRLEQSLASHRHPLSVMSWLLTCR